MNVDRYVVKPHLLFTLFLAQKNEKNYLIIIIITFIHKYFNNVINFIIIIFLNMIIMNKI